MKTSSRLAADALKQGCQTRFLEGRTPAEFIFSPVSTHFDQVYLIWVKAKLGQAVRPLGTKFGTRVV